MAASNGETAPADALQPPSHVIIPPKVIRDNIVKTADYCNRHGGDAEEKMLARVRGQEKPTLPFVLPEDQYYPYYKWYLQLLREGKGPAAASAQTGRDNKPKGPPAPPGFIFSARMPNISAKDLEILRLTALYTARIGENWLKELRSRETGNFQFDFLRANHSFFAYFRSLVDQYKTLLEEDNKVEERIEELQHNIKDRFHILDRAKMRAAYVKYTIQQKEKEEKKNEDERNEYLSIDWYDFGIIATVVFDDNEDTIELPPPANLAELQSASLEQKAMVSLSSKRIEEARPDEVPYYNATQPVPPMPGYPPMAPPVQPVYAPMPPAPVDYRNSAPQREDEVRSRQAERDRIAQAQAAARGAPNAMRIKTDYVPRGKKVNVSTVVCPNCKQTFPPEEIEEHIRIELLDPRWKDQRAKTEARYSTVITPNEAANNLKRFASQRDDIYDGVTGAPISEEEAARRKKAATSYDGQPDPTKDAARLQQMQSMNLQDQLRSIQARHGGGQ